MVPDPPEPLRHHPGLERAFRTFRLSDFQKCPPNYSLDYIVRACDDSLERSHARRHKARHQVRWYVEVAVLAVLLVAGGFALVWAIGMLAQGHTG